LDADSVPSPDWLARVAQVFESESELTALSGPGKFYGSTPLVHWIAENLYIGGYIFAIGLLLGHPPLFGSNLALRASAWRRLRPSVHRELREIHDDFDLSIHLEPDMVVRFDHSLVVGVSARPFETAAGLGRRTWWALAMLVEHSRERPFWERRAARRQWEREQAEEAFG
ncbi:MAG: hypothetical protein Q8M65_11365, partial [Rhodoglobus sp.]|nr:hypothetical protein [Rhodoglobus sp.]